MQGVVQSPGTELGLGCVPLLLIVHWCLSPLLACTTYIYPSWSNVLSNLRCPRFSERQYISFSDPNGGQRWTVSTQAYHQYIQYKE